MSKLILSLNGGEIRGVAVAWKIRLVKKQNNFYQTKIKFHLHK